jgi:hypothetical protein
MNLDGPVRKSKVAMRVVWLVIGLAAPVICSASVFSSSVSLTTFGIPLPPNGQPGYEIQTWTQPNNTGDGAFLDLTINSNLVLSAYDYTVGIGEAWYGVTNGTIFSPSTQSSLTPFANNLAAPFTPGQIQLSLGQNFYLAFWLQEPPNNEYGWAHLQYTVSGLTLLGNEIEDSGSGIIVGTAIVVPEPSACYLTVLALASLLVCRSRVIVRSRKQV